MAQLLKSLTLVQRVPSSIHMYVLLLTSTCLAGQVQWMTKTLQSVLIREPDCIGPTSPWALCENSDE